MNTDILTIQGHTFHSRLILGTGKFSSPIAMQKAIESSGTEMVTVAIKRIDIERSATDNLLSYIDTHKVKLLPNTSGARNAKEAVFIAELAREALQTNWIKLEIHPDVKYLMPDPVETLQAAKELVKSGFIVLPYIHADPVLCKHLEEAGVAAVMPLGAPIGTNKGLKTLDFLEIIIEQSRIPVIVDAGLGAPSHACMALEMGADAVLVNTAIAVADDPIIMAQAFAMAVKAGRDAFKAKLPAIQPFAQATSPLTSFLED